MPLSFSASYCFSFLTLAFLLGMEPPRSFRIVPGFGFRKRLSAGERDLAEPSRPVGIEALGAGERPREELAGHDREQGAEQAGSQDRGSEGSTRRPAVWAALPLAINAAPVARIRSAASSMAGSVSSAEATAQTGKSGSSAATGPCARSVAVSGSAAILVVSSSLSAISRAVANSAPRPITNIRPVNAKDAASGTTRRSRSGMSPSSSSETSRMPPA